MALSAFIDKQQPPGDRELRRVLGKSFEAWARLLHLVSDRLAPVAPVWAFASGRIGWGLRLKRKDRIILYMTPRIGHFLVSFALGEKAVAAAHARKFPAPVLKVIEAAPRYAEGRGVRFEVENTRQVPALVRLAEIKNEH